MTSAEDLERAVLDEHEPRWRELGYTVIRDPRGDQIPEFLMRFRPDALAIGQLPNLVIEVIRKGAPNAEEKVRRLTALLGNRPDWRLEVLYSGEAEAGVKPASQAEISEMINTGRRIAVQEPRAGLLLLWAALEALARGLDPRNASRPQTPGRVVELLAGAGYIAPSEADRLRTAVVQRNRLIHGDLSVRPLASDVSSLVAIANGLLTKLPHP